MSSVLQVQQLYTAGIPLLEAYLLPMANSRTHKERVFQTKWPLATWSRIGEKYNFHGENFHRLLTFAMPKDATPPNFAEKTFANSHKTMKVFSLESFPLYGKSFYYSE